MGFEELSTLYLEPEDEAHLALNSPLKLHRAWPRSSQKLELEYRSSDNQLCVGFWFLSGRQLARIASSSVVSLVAPEARTRVLPKKNILLLKGGADRKLIGLSTLLSQKGTELLVHKPERRAVVRLVDRNKIQYVKIVRPHRIQQLVNRAQTLSNLKSANFTVPKLQNFDHEQGLTTWSRLPGISFNRLLEEKENKIEKYANGNGRCSIQSSAYHIGEALRELHDSRLSNCIRSHGAQEEIRVLRKWLGKVRVYLPTKYIDCSQYFDLVCGSLAASSSPPSLLHRDFYDKQIIIENESRVGFLDFDTLAFGEAALDLANVLVHLELRIFQRLCTYEKATAVGKAVIDGYKPDIQLISRLPAYADATRLRLACVYAFRPLQPGVTDKMLSHIGKPLIGLRVDGVHLKSTYL